MKRRAFRPSKPPRSESLELDSSEASTRSCSRGGEPREARAHAEAGGRELLDDAEEATEVAAHARRHVRDVAVDEAGDVGLVGRHDAGLVGGAHAAREVLHDDVLPRPRGRRASRGRPRAPRIRASGQSRRRSPQRRARRTRSPPSGSCVEGAEEAEELHAADRSRGDARAGRRTRLPAVLAGAALRALAVARLIAVAARAGEVAAVARRAGSAGSSSRCS